MFELFNDAFKYGFNFKVKGKFKVKYKKIVKRAFLGQVWYPGSGVVLDCIDS